MTALHYFAIFFAVTSVACLIGLRLSFYLGDRRRYKRMVEAANSNHQRVPRAFEPEGVPVSPRVVRQLDEINAQLTQVEQSRIIRASLRKAPKEAHTFPDLP